MIKLTTNIVGTFALKNGKIIEMILFPRDPVKIAEKLEIIRDSLCDEEREMIQKLIKSSVNTVHVIDPNRFKNVFQDIEFLEDGEPVDPIEIARDVGISRDEFIDLLAKSNMELSRRKLRKIGRDRLVIQSVASVDELDDTINKLVKRLREWYSLRFPELDYMIKKHDTYAMIVSSKTESLDNGLLEKIEKIREESCGMEFSEGDVKPVMKLSNSILELYSAKQKIEEYIEKLMKEIAPNISELAGPMLGARLISLAGSLERLSQLPASTIQVLGAEDAFFRFLRTKKKPPKHGAIFQLPEIRSAPKKKRGKISRTFAAKLAIAAKTDYFKGKFIGDRLRKEFLSRVRDMK
ncbi:MAG TPA: C/D box methylation guide ribonucleoprotein complex aNOP56 subunit [Candidatus Altiarchaeales archaeon]|nr:C/D box methylation guide ribonucleoprotein complex aNOP56 subunit [Candidatus Altiarchaeales archaeon]